MDRIYHKPYLADIFGTTPGESFFVYPREALLSAPLFDYLVIDGGAALLMADLYGDGSAETLLARTQEGSVLCALRDGTGAVDYGRSYHECDRHGMPRRHELQSWPQRLYHLLPLAAAYMRTGEHTYADGWLTHLRDWIAASPYEPLDAATPHTATTMKWRDMQCSWRTQVLLYSVYMLGTHEGTFPREVWEEIYAFLILNLDHLVKVASLALERSRLGNHTLQMSTALITAGTVLPELPRADAYLDLGLRVMRACFAANVLPDGGTRELGPSYNHFIARLYLEAQLNCELNGHAGIEGLHASLIRQYEWLAAMAREDGTTLPFSDAYVMDGAADVRRMAALIPFTPSELPASRYLPNSGHAILRRGAWELAIDAQETVGGHQHHGRIQPVLRYAGEDVLVDSGCCNYDRADLYDWMVSADAHSVVFCEELPEDFRLYNTRVTHCSTEDTTLTAVYTYQSGEDTYTWERTATLYPDRVELCDRVSASRPLAFTGHWYMPGRPTAMAEDGDSARLHYRRRGTVAKQEVAGGYVTLTSSMPLVLTPAVGIGADRHTVQNACLSWRAVADALTVTTVIAFTPVE